MPDSTSKVGTTVGPSRTRPFTCCSNTSSALGIRSNEFCAFRVALPAAGGNAPGPPAQKTNDDTKASDQGSSALASRRATNDSCPSDEL